MFPEHFVPPLLQLPERIARSSPAARLWPLVSVCGQRVDDACWQRRSRQTGCSSLGALTLVRAQICKHAGTKGQGSWNGNFPRGLECSWPFVQALYSVCVIHQKRELWVNLVALEPQTDGDPDVSSCGDQFLPAPTKRV